MRNGESVRAFEAAFCEYVGAEYAIALVNGTATLHTALVALGVKPGDKVATTPLTMSATSIAILQAGAVPVYCDVTKDTWLFGWMPEGTRADRNVSVVVDLYGLSLPWQGSRRIVDAAQTLRKHSPDVAFTSYSFQASKILALGEGGMLVTDSEELAIKAREFSSLGYKMKADQPRISSDVLKSPDYERHHLAASWNYRMNDLTAERGLHFLDNHTTKRLDLLKWDRLRAAEYYREAIEGCSWLTPQYEPEGWTHDYWCYAIALESKELWKSFTEAIVRHGGEMPYGAWQLTYREPAFRHLAYWEGIQPNGIEHLERHHTKSVSCPVAESLQPRLVQFQTNNLESAERNAKAVRKAIDWIEHAGTRNSTLRSLLDAAARARDIIAAQPIPTEGRWIGDENGWHDPCS